MQDVKGAAQERVSSVNEEKDGLNQSVWSLKDRVEKLPVDRESLSANLVAFSIERYSLRELLAA